MGFISLEFLVFLPTFFLLYWSLRNRLQWQNLFVILASYVFYGWADWRYMCLIGGYTAWSFLSGLYLGREKSTLRRKITLYLTIAVNLGVLGLYKYYDFFADNFNKVFSAAGIPLDWPMLHLILPIGISFYTFQALSYTIDVYRGKLTPTRDIISFFAFLSFFPQLVAGPIERADTLLPQFQRKRTFSYSEGVAGMKRILWGLFKKMVIADNCGIGADYIFSTYASQDSFNLFLGAVFFTFQIYGDFSGYSDIAIGSARLLGINLMENFKLPYFSVSVKQFWRRWHISLNLWFKDYIYIPLGGSRRGLLRLIIAIMAVFFCSGLWHGASWHYILYGIYSGICVLICFFYNKILTAIRESRAMSMFNRKYRPLIPPAIFRAKTVLMPVFYFCLTAVVILCGRIIFRSECVSFGLVYLRRMFTCWDGFTPAYDQTYVLLVYIAVLLAMELWSRNWSLALDFPRKGLLKFTAVRWFLFWVIAIGVFLLGGEAHQFIYFQF